MLYLTFVGPKNQTKKMLSDLLSICYRSTGIHKSSVAHADVNRVTDVQSMIDDLVKAEVFEKRIGRCHSSFPGISGNPFIKTNMVVVEVTESQILQSTRCL